jgi:hypothetical protein
MLLEILLTVGAQVSKFVLEDFYVVLSCFATSLIKDSVVNHECF